MTTAVVRPTALSTADLTSPAMAKMALENLCAGWARGPPDASLTALLEQAVAGLGPLHANCLFVHTLCELERVCTSREELIYTASAVAAHLGRPSEALSRAFAPDGTVFFIYRPTGRPRRRPQPIVICRVGPDQVFDTHVRLVLENHPTADRAHVEKEARVGHVRAACKAQVHSQATRETPAAREAPAACEAKATYELLVALAAARARADAFLTGQPLPGPAPTSGSAVPASAGRPSAFERPCRQGEPTRTKRGKKGRR